MQIINAEKLNKIKGLPEGFVASLKKSEGRLAASWNERNERATVELAHEHLGLSREGKIHAMGRRDDDDFFGDRGMFGPNNDDAPLHPAMHGPAERFILGIIYTMGAFAAAFAGYAFLYFTFIKPAMTLAAWVAAGFAAVSPLAWAGLAAAVIAGGLLYVNRTRGTISKKK